MSSLATGLGRGAHSNSFAINHTFDYIIRETKVGCASREAAALTVAAARCCYFRTI